MTRALRILCAFFAQLVPASLAWILAYVVWTSSPYGPAVVAAGVLVLMVVIAVRLSGDPAEKPSKIMEREDG